MGSSVCKSLFAGACENDLFVVLRYSLKAGGQNIPAAICMGLCSPVPKGTAGYDGGGTTEVPAAGTQRAFDVASHLPVLGGL